MIQDLWHYARRHPVKAFFAIVVPLVSAGGALHGLLRQFGVKLPMGLDGGSRSYRGGYYGSDGYGERSSFGRQSSSGLGGGMMGNLGSIMKVAGAFM